MVWQKRDVGPIRDVGREEKTTGTPFVWGWVTLVGQGQATAVTFLPHRRQFLWVGDARRVVVQVEIKELTAANAPPNHVTLRLETSAREDGVWSPVGTGTSWTGPGTYTVYLDRNPSGTSGQRVSGYLRWALVEHAGDGGSGTWTACFRIVVILEPV
ncbi:MAG: hypothetical protein FJ087_05070 [Deltaproteobacteria bacterium]|nr:hypothetical protein [Deltaproteobacteria bacterium]